MKVFATAKGAAIRIGSYGIATDEVGLEVPDAVAAQLEDEIAGMPRDIEEPDPADPSKTVKIRRETHERRADLRVVRERKPAAPRAAAGSPEKGKE